MEEVIIRAAGLEKSYPGFKLDGVNINLPKGYVMGFLGPNGSGFGVDVGKKVKDLSRGTRVKFALGVALAYRPRLLILDEPTSGLDPVARQEILSELMRVVQDEEGAVIFSSHITQDVEKIADYITFIRDGQVVLAGVKDDILDSWKRVLFRLEDGKVTPDWHKEFVALAGSGCEYKGVANNFSLGLRTFLREQGAKDVREENLSLDEIFLALVKGVC